MGRATRALAEGGRTDRNVGPTAQFTQWNDRSNDNVRRFWCGDVGSQLASRLTGSGDIFGSPTCGFNFLAAHERFTLADLIARVDRHNHADGEDDRDGHGDDLSWNHGVERLYNGPAFIAAGDVDLPALLTPLFATRGAIQLTAGDEFGRSQEGDDNAYAHDNAIGWVDWTARAIALKQYVAELARWRRARPAVYALPFRMRRRG